MICFADCFQYLCNQNIIECRKKPIDVIENYLSSYVACLRDDSDFEKACGRFDDLIGKLQTFKQDESKDEDEERLEPSLEMLDQVSSVKRRETNVSKRTALISALDTTHETPIQKVVKEIILVLQDFFDKYLGHYSEVLWNEIIYFSNSGRIQKAFNPSTRLAIHSAIVNPGYFLNTDESFDVTILHKLYLECGRLINMYDWFVAFKTMIDPDSKLSDKDAQ